MKKLILNLKNRKNYCFSIKTETLKNGKTYFTPQVKEPGVFGTWNQIIKVYDSYIMFEYGRVEGMTYADAVNHINGFKKQLSIKEENDILSISINLI